MGEEAVEHALRALRHRERSADQVTRHLESRGISQEDRAEAIATLTRTGLVDDRRFAESRAAALVARGAGDALVRHDLVSAGIDRETIEDVLEGLEDEAVRARRVVERRGASPKTERYLRGKGFSPEAAHAAVAEDGAETLG
jgi:regulatory protein